MRLKEIEMDLPYVKNQIFIEKVQEVDGLEREAAVRKDYEVNWKEKRRKFQLMTRCMTSMVERIMEPIDTGDCWKIIFECVDNEPEYNYKNLLGVYVVQVRLDVKEFEHASDCNKKMLIIEKILEGIAILSNQITFETTAIYDACMQIIRNDYLNEWVWKKSLKLNNKIVQIKIKHEINNLGIYMVFSSLKHDFCKQVLLINTIPDERVYYTYLGDLERISEKEVALITKTGEKFVQLCE